VVHVLNTRRGLLVAALTCGLTGAVMAPAMAQSAAAPTISFKMVSGGKISGNVFVQWANKKFDTVKITGAISSATSGEVLGLFAQPFPYRKAPVAVAGQSKTLATSTTSVAYSFTAKPQIATRYSVRVYASSSAKAPLASSITQTAYVVTNQVAFGFKSCNTRGNRPVCHQTLKIYTALPASAFKIESAKKWYFYFAVNLNPTHIPALPKTLVLDTSARISKAHRISATVFERTVTFTFRVNNDAYNSVFKFCSKDTESSDGVNMPGHHGCGAHRVSANGYLG
jgi:hypothetical protein